MRSLLKALLVFFFFAGILGSAAHNALADSNAEHEHSHCAVCLFSSFFKAGASSAPQALEIISNFRLVKVEHNFSAPALPAKSQVDFSFYTTGPPLHV